MFFDGVNQQTVSQAQDGFKEFKIGDNHACISKVEEKTSESGNPMLEITFVDEEGASIRYYIVDGEWKLSKLKQLYVAFGIPVGETNIKKWIGTWGTVVCKAGKPYNGNVYNQVSYVRPDTSGQQKSVVQPHKQSEPAASASQADDYFADDIPF